MCIWRMQTILKEGKFWCIVILYYDECKYQKSRDTLEMPSVLGYDEKIT